MEPDLVDPAMLALAVLRYTTLARLIVVLLSLARAQWLLMAAQSRCLDEMSLPLYRYEANFLVDHASVPTMTLSMVLNSLSLPTTTSGAAVPRWISRWKSRARM